MHGSNGSVVAVVDDHPLPQTPTAQTADRLIAEGPAGWRLGRFGDRGRRIARLVSRILRGGAPYQQVVDRNLLESVGHVDRRVDTLVARLDARDRTLAALSGRVDAEVEHADDLASAIETVRATITARIGDPHELPRIEDIVVAARARPYMAEPSFQTWSQPGAGIVMGYQRRATAGAGAADAYKRFEDRFRGPEKRVMELQRPYLPLLDGHGPVLDAGCGRGEMLDLLRECDIACHGVDLDAGMVARCVAKGHAGAELASVTTHLAAVPDGHYGAIFSAQLIEHLPHELLDELLALATRKLRPGGLLIAETVNPHAPHALRAFWTDLTHQHPIYPEVALTLCELAGFASAYVFHPTGTGDVDADTWTQSAYAVVARTDSRPDAPG